MDTRSVGEPSNTPHDEAAAIQAIPPEMVAAIKRLVGEQLQPLEARLQVLEQELARLAGREELRD